MSSFFQLEILTESSSIQKSSLDPLSTSIGTMDDDDISEIESPGELTEQSAMEKQLASLQTYLDSLPYECETVEEMQARLQEIVQKIYVCARTKNWLVLSTWDGMLQWYTFKFFLIAVRHSLFLSKAGY